MNHTTLWCKDSEKGRSKEKYEHRRPSQPSVPALIVEIHDLFAGRQASAGIVAEDTDTTSFTFERVSTRSGGQLIVQIHIA
jgi:hypothetical protein